jgi:hypothetical protein
MTNSKLGIQPARERTPAEHRAAVAAWRETAPANDSDIIPRKSRQAGNGPMAARLSALLAWSRAAPGSNASTFLEANNDNTPVEEGGHATTPDREHRIRPSENNLLAAFKDFRDLGAKDLLSSEDIEWRDGVCVRMGSLEFSDGTRTERAMVRKAGRTVVGEVRLPKGGLLHTVDEAGAPLGPAIPRSNGGMAKMLRGAKLPYGSLCDQFLGMQCAATGQPGAPAWEDTFTALADRHEYRRWVAELKERDVEVLDAAMEARNYADIGAIDGHEGEYARHAGKRMLIAANDNLASVMKKVAA